MIRCRSGWSARRSPYRSTSCGGKYAAQHLLQRRVVRQRRGDEVLAERHLHVGDEDGELGRRQPAAGVHPLRQLGVRRQELQPAVELAALLQRVHEALVDAEHVPRLPARVAEQHVLLVVVAQHVPPDVVRHLREQLVALLEREVAVGDDLVEQDLDVDLVVRAVDAGRVVDRVGVHADAVQRRLHPAELGEAEVAALADHPDAELVAVHPDRVVRLVADVRVRLGRRLDVGADAAVPQQVGGRLEDRLHAARPASSRSSPTAGPGGARPDGEIGTDFAAREYTPPPGLSSVGVVVRPRRARQPEQPLPLRERHLGIGVGVEEDVPVVERRHQPDVLARAASRCRRRRRSCRRRRPR